MKENRIALRPYLKTVETTCRQLSKDELVELVLGLAGDEPAMDRISFLDKINAHTPVMSKETTALPNLDRLLEEIQALKEDIVERIEAIENGDYEALVDWDWEDSHWDDEPDMISEEQMEDLTELFDDAGSLFLDGNIKDAKILYEALFDLLEEAFMFDYYTAELTLEIKEERARYARCVYETSDTKNRAKALAGVMNLDASGRFDNQEINPEYPMLNDLMDAGKEDMEGLEKFYPSWKKLLSGKNLQGRTASLLIETVYITEGLAGVEKLAVKWGNTQSYGYLFWLERLRDEEDWDQVLTVSQKAMGVIEGKHREKMTDYMIEAASELSRDELVVEGKFEKFFSNPCDQNMMTVLKEANEQGNRDDGLASVIDYYGRKKSLNDNEENLYMKALLMNGDLEAAWKMIKPSSKSLGWSGGLNIGLVFGSVAAAVSGSPEKCDTISRLIKLYSAKTAIYSYQFSYEDIDQGTFFYNEILTGIARKRVSDNQMAHFFDWVFITGRDRIDSIVSNTHRGAYERAALVLGGLAEIHAAKEDRQKAEELLHEFCKIKYNRHTAFKREVKNVINQSGLLRKLSILV